MRHDHKIRSLYPTQQYIHVTDPPQVLIVLVDLKPGISFSKFPRNGKRTVRRYIVRNQTDKIFEGLRLNGTQRPAE